METMKKLILFIVVLALAPIVVASTVMAADLTVDEIVERANFASYYGGDDGKARVKMVIKSDSGSERSREFTILRKDVVDGGKQFYYVYFHKPGDVKKLVFMVHKKVGMDDDRWLFLPAMDLVRRVAASDGRTSFVGSHFYYEDVSGRDVSADTHKLESVTDKAYVLLSTPKDPISVEFKEFRTWVDKVNFLPVKAEYVNSKGVVYRSVEALKVEDIDGVPTVMEARVKDLIRGGETLMSFTKVKYNLGLEESLFTERFLRNPPRKHLRR
jgi:outer membrane lipoprotein-sorting protein